MILLVGTSQMAVDYANVLKAQKRDFRVVGRGAANAAAFTEKTDVPVIAGGLTDAIASGKLSGVTTAIVSVGVEALFDVNMTLLQFGLKNMLIEKPGVMKPEQVTALRDAVQQAAARAYIGYNRRFYASVRRAREIIQADGGLTSFTFDFTEWSDDVAATIKPASVKDYWVLANSSHVLDLAFHLGGPPAELHATRTGALDWHRSGAVFAGSGVTTQGAPFAYHADWGAPGRWGLELCTHRHKLIFRPVEKLHAMRKGSVQIEEVALDSEDAKLDVEFKPGLYRQVEAFFGTDAGALCTLDELVLSFRHFSTIAGYTP